MAFKFSKNVVVSGVYNQVRNPMAVGYYLTLLGVGLMAHSTWFTFFSLLVVIPSHIFYIKYFEEFEVELRLGESYVEYKRQTPFLIPRIF
jgi:protein-S-isoprenylcysteine O-methyltransferase Ste14